MREFLSQTSVTQHHDSSPQHAPGPLIAFDVAGAAADFVAWFNDLVDVLRTRARGL